MDGSRRLCGGSREVWEGCRRFWRGAGEVLGGPGGVYKYSLEPYLKRLLVHTQKRIEKAFSENLDTTAAKKYFQTAQASFKAGKYLDFLVTIQQARVQLVKLA